MRNAVLIAWLKALTWPTQQLYTTFGLNRAADLYRLKITPQVVYLQRLLNDRYDIASRRIRVVDSIFHDPTYIYTASENKSRYLRRKSENAPTYIYRRAETQLDPADFTIEIPADIQYQEPELRGIVDAYKLAGKTYTIDRI